MKPLHLNSSLTSSRSCLVSDVIRAGLQYIICHYMLEAAASYRVHVIKRHIATKRVLFVFREEQGSS